MRQLPVYLVLVIVAIVGFSAHRASVEMQNGLLQQIDDWDDDSDLFVPPIQFQDAVPAPEMPNVVPQTQQPRPDADQQPRVPGQP